LEYPLADRLMDAATRIEGLCTSWLRHAANEIARELPNADEQLRKRFEETLSLIDLLHQRYSLKGTDFRRIRGLLHRLCGIMEANKFNDGRGALRHLREAYACDPNEPHTIVNYCRACSMALRQGESRTVLDEGIRVAEEYLRNPSAVDRQQVEIDLHKLQRLRDHGPEGPPDADFLPRLIEPTPEN
jgi:hypothetical protein